MKTTLIAAFSILSGILNAQYTKLFDFNSAVGGIAPYANSLFSDGSFLYGAVSEGGTNGYGTLFKIKPDGSSYSTLFDFNTGPGGNEPCGSLISDGTFLYGMTMYGGTSSNCSNLGCGTIFKIKPDGSSYAKLLDFTGANGQWPHGSLIYDGTFLYGMTNEGGTSLGGVIFKIKPDGTGYTKLFEFTAQSTGLWPRGSLISDGTYLYGTASSSGANSSGVVFKIKTDGSGFTKLLDFAGNSDGRYPYGSLVSDGTFLYGTTSEGGTSDSGVVFKIKTDGTGYAKLLDFAGNSNGSFPTSDLVFDGNFLYGMTEAGGANYRGALFKIKPDGTGYADLVDFAGASNGRNPSGSLIFDGACLYGMTELGGLNNEGTVFKYTLSPNSIVENKTDLDISVFPSPCSTQLTIKTKSAFNNTTLSLYNLYGQVVRQVKNLTGQSITLLRDNLPAGLYTLQLTQDGRVILNDKVMIVD